MSLQAAVDRSGRCQGSGSGGEAADLRGDRSAGTDSAGRVDCPHRISGICVPQTTRCFHRRIRLAE